MLKEKIKIFFRWVEMFYMLLTFALLIGFLLFLPICFISCIVSAVFYIKYMEVYITFFIMYIIIIYFCYSAFINDIKNNNVKDDKIDMQINLLDDEEH